MTFRIGLTGSIGMGKSTTASLFAKLGCDVWDADAAVHRAYTKGGSAVDSMSRAFPTAIIEGAVSRDQLRRILQSDATALRRIEQIVHPLVAADRAAFIENSIADIVVLDIPLLFETGSDAMMNATVCVTVDKVSQKARVMARATMTEAQFNTILTKQMPDTEKQKRADYVIVTDTLEHAQTQVQTVVRDIRQRLADA